MKNSKRFTGNENHAITTAEALTFIKQYREHFGPDDGDDKVHGFFFDHDHIP